VHTRPLASQPTSAASVLPVAEIRSPSTEGHVGSASAQSLDHRPTSRFLRPGMTCAAPDLGTGTYRSWGREMLHRCTTYLPGSTFFFKKCF
jgi:hypothetical protein